MISSKIKIVLLAVIIFGSSVVWAADEVWSGTGKITGSPHDLGGTTSGAVGSDDNGEICVYCHTPHAANTAFTGAPLWNKGATAGISYMVYGATVADTNGTTIANSQVSGTPASPSLACLSCHDGVSAIDSIVNAPGSGAGSLSAGTQTLQDLVLTNALTNIGNTTDAAGTAGGLVNLTNDHPVSVAYTEGRASLRATGDTLDTTTYGNWVGATLVSDLLRNGNVECGSCHDPHNGYSTGQDGKEVNFLRYTNKESRLCIGCHNK